VALYQYHLLQTTHINEHLHTHIIGVITLSKFELQHQGRPFDAPLHYFD
jgi:hypothetical protein